MNTVRIQPDTQKTLCFVSNVSSNSCFATRYSAITLKILTRVMTFRDKEKVMLIDFGLAVKYDDESEAIEWKGGTPEYSAPEVRRTSVTHRL